MMRARSIGLTGCALLALAAGTARAADQTVPGAGNAQAAALAARSPLVSSALLRLQEQISLTAGRRLRVQTEDALFNPQTCVQHRAGVTAAVKSAILARLLAAGLYSPADAAAFPGGAAAGIFPPVRDDGRACPHLPQGFGTAPGSNFGGHQSYPGGLAVHESFNVSSAASFDENYRLAYGLPGPDGLPRMAPLPPFGLREAARRSDLAIARDTILLAPMWHDWAKTLVFQWNADGTEFAEFSFGGNGLSDSDGAAGDSRTGGHHILSLAESVARDLPAPFVIAQASAHSAPTLGNEFKVVNWLRTASIIAQVDPVARGYLAADAAGHLRLPPVRTTDTIDLNAAGQTNILVEYEIHNLSDADFVFSIPAVTTAQVLLQNLAPRYGYDPASTATYNTRYRNPALAFLSGERITILYTNGGLSAVREALDNLRARKVI
ncbi:MAG: hypothetical protein ACRYGC_00390 [Janthinobacterium lividum]